MLDYANITMYRENNRIEAKKAAGGLPQSIWETYSAFANTIGGVILLGVEELRGHALRPIALADPEGMIAEFWAIVNDPKRVSVNILTPGDVQIHEQDGGRFISIAVPRAHRYDRPVYIDGNPLTGTYRRNGEGDYRCKADEVQAMMRDAAMRTQDMQVLGDFGMDAMCMASVRAYRERLAALRPGHALLASGDEDFLYRIGAAGRGEDGAAHPTGGGLLMFGYEYEIARRYPGYFLDYRARMGGDGRITSRLSSSSGDWSGNLFDFYARVRGSWAGDEALSGDGGVLAALCEALANSLINADYDGRGGVTVERAKDGVTISNPGGFRIGMEDAKAGGVSDPRNAALMKMFNLIRVGERAGSGIPSIFAAWKARGWKEPVLRETLSPERTSLTLSFEPAQAVEQEDGARLGLAALLDTEAVLGLLTGRIEATAGELAAALAMDERRVRRILCALEAGGLVSARGDGPARRYRLYR